MNHVTIDDRLESVALEGAYELPLHIWGNTAKRLTKNGLVLTRTGADNGTKGQHHYVVSWKNAALDIPDGPFDLDEMFKYLQKRQSPISHANMLWLMAECHNRK